MTTITRLCPNPHCQDEITITNHPHKNRGTCGSCGQDFTVDYDGEQIDGVWHDKTTLHLVNRIPDV